MAQYPGASGATAPAKSNISPIALHQSESHYVFGKLASGATQLPIQDGNVAGEATGVLPYASVAVNLQMSNVNAQPMVCIEVAFVLATTGLPSAPGAFEVDIQEADTDADAAYFTPTNANYTINTVNATSQRVRVDLSPTGGKFMRLSVKTLTNAATVNILGKITRLA